MKEDTLTTEQKIIYAARELIAKNGYKATTTKMIAKTAGVNEATLFRNFKNKENLLLQLINLSFYENRHESLSRLFERKVSSLEEMEAFLVDFGIAFYQDYLVENKEIAFISLFEAEDRQELGELMARSTGKVIDQMMDMLQKQKGKGLFQSENYFVAILIYIQSLVATFIMNYKIKVDFYPLSIEEQCRETAKIILYGIR